MSLFDLLIHMCSPVPPEDNYLYDAVAERRVEWEWAYRNRLPGSRFPPPLVASASGSGSTGVHNNAAINPVPAVAAPGAVNSKRPTTPPCAGPIRQPRTVQARRQGIMMNPVLSGSEKRTIDFLRREREVEVKSLFTVLNETAKSNAVLEVELKLREADIEYLEEEMRAQRG